MDWKVFRIFISSTFCDMHHERDHMLPEVFQYLNTYLRGRSAGVESVDLRWGVDDSEQIDDEEKRSHIINACLDELERSDLMVVMLGERYGTLVEAKRGNEITCKMAFLFETGPVSITALEVMYGLVSKKLKGLDVWEREFDYSTIPVADRSRYSDQFRSEIPGLSEDEKGEAVRAAEALKILKQELKRQRCGYFAYNGATLAAAATDLSVQLKQRLRRKLDEMTGDRLVSSPWDLATIEAYTSYHVAKSDVSMLSERDHQQRLLTFAQTGVLNGDTVSGVVLLSEPGGGKSANLSVFAHLLSQSENAPVTLFHVAKLHRDAPYLLFVLNKWCSQLLRVLHQTDTTENDWRCTDLFSMKKRFFALLSEAVKNHAIVILLDGVDELERSPEGRFVTWFPSRLPPGVRFIMTAVEGQETEILSKRDGVACLDIPMLDDTQLVRNLDQFTRDTGKSIPAEVRRRISEKCRPDGKYAYQNPLWLRTLIQQLKLVDGEDIKRARSAYPNGSTESQDTRMLCSLVEKMPADIGSQLIHLVERVHRLMERLFNVSWSRRAIELIAVSRSGLRVADLNAIIDKGDRNFQQHFAILKLYLSDHLYSSPDGRWTLHNRAAREALLQELHACNTLRALHERLSVYHATALDRSDHVRQEGLLFHVISAEKWVEVASLLIEGSDTDVAVMGEFIAALLDERPHSVFPTVTASWEAMVNAMFTRIGTDNWEALIKRLLFTLYPLVRARMTKEACVAYLAPIAPFASTLANSTETSLGASLCAVHKSLLGMIYIDTDIDAAQRLLAEAIPLLSHIPRRLETGVLDDDADMFSISRNLSISLTVMGDCALHKGDRLQARAFLDQSLRISHSLKRCALGETFSPILDCDLGIAQTKYAETFDDPQEQERWYGSAWACLKRSMEDRRVPFLLAARPQARTSLLLSNLLFERYQQTGDPETLRRSKDIADYGGWLVSHLKELDPQDLSLKQEPLPKIYSCK